MRFEEAALRLSTWPGRLPRGPAELIPMLADERLRPRFEATGTAREAAVLALLYPDERGDARIVLTERVTYDGHHSGEVSLPGGKAEPGDDGPAGTALREAAEEIGLDPDAAELTIAGSLDEVFIPVSDFRITPVVALARRPPRLTANPSEVARILEPPISAFLPGAPLEIVERVIREWPLRYGGYRIEGLHVWGATGRILGQLGAVLGDAAVAGDRPACSGPM
jgi:8-oxo-dGTP pyrophosphatase MutT (NUDIX family)